MLLYFYLLIRSKKVAKKECFLWNKNSTSFVVVVVYLSIDLISTKDDFVLLLREGKSWMGLKPLIA